MSGINVLFVNGDSYDVPTDMTPEAFFSTTILIHSDHLQGAKVEKISDELNEFGGYDYHVVKDLGGKGAEANLEELSFVGLNRVLDYMARNYGGFRVFCQKHPASFQVSVSADVAPGVIGVNTAAGAGVAFKAALLDFDRRAILREEASAAEELEERRQSLQARYDEILSDLGDGYNSDLIDELAEIDSELRELNSEE